MNIVLKRYRIKPDTIDGQIWIDGLKVCDCAENAHHCLPLGEYQITVHKCRHHARKMPVVLPKPNCEDCAQLSYVGNNTSMPCKCAQLCPGNGVYNRTDGAILVGKYIAPGCLSHPKSAFDNLYDRIRKNVERQKQREQNRACSNSAESRPGGGNSQRGNEIALTITTL